MTSLSNPRYTERRRRGVAATFACIATLASAVAHGGIALPGSPPQAGTVVPPNIMFVLDDSGSMAETRLPDDPPDTSNTNISDRAYTRNTIFYNPNTTYKPWRNANGSYMADANYAAASNNATNLTSPVNLGANEQTFHVPLSTDSATFGDGRNYARFRLLADGTARRCLWRLAQADWNNCTTVSSFTWDDETRTLEEEKQNYANWYQYHRTRSKVAKAGASDAFNEIGKDVRVGFNTIHNRSPFEIPVGTDGGIFDDVGSNTNRSTWFSRLFNATANDVTPLKAALNRTGLYYQRSDASGPYGPEAGTSQISCRQNFTILTTDGYANESAFATVNHDNTAGPSHTGPNGRNFSYVPSRPYMDNVTGTLADIAMQFWKFDLRSDLTNNVPTTTANPAFWQHMVTFGISIGAKGNLEPATDLPAITAGTKAWPTTTPANLTPATIDDFWHATVNGRGDFVVASDPADFVSSLRNALSAILARTTSNANIAVTSTRIDGGTRVFEPSYNTGEWTGEVKAYPITNAGVSGTPSWYASQGIPAHDVRRVFTWNGGAGREFLWANLSLAQRTALGTAQVLDYIRGDASLEVKNGGTFRDRSSRLGDVIHSSPVYDVATQTLYVGANDGMLHAINAATGAERFAYVPSGIDFDDLKTLSNKDYAHRYFVDGEIVVTTPAQTPGRRILIGLLGHGAKSGRPSVYALDVTDPSSFNASKVLWEFSDPDLVNALGKPIVAKLESSGDAGVIIGNGYNGATDRSMLFVLDPLTGALIAKVDTAAGSAAAPNGLASPKGWDNDLDGAVDFVYAGDLLGNVWRFDLNGNPNTWNNGGKVVKLFQARDSANKIQPITGGVSIGKHPVTFQRWVFFGTGRYLTTADAVDKSVQSWYGIEDKGTLVGGRTGSDLRQRRFINQTTATGRVVRVIEPGTAGDMVGKKGWYIDLLQPPAPGTPMGERMVNDSILFGGVLLAASNIPDSAVCGEEVRGFINAIDPFNGTATGSPFFDVNGDGKVDDGDKVDDGSGGKEVVGSVDLGNGYVTNPVIVGNQLVAGGLVKSIGVGIPDFAGRVSWRELIRD